MIEEISNHIEINYRLTGAGWSACDITVGAHHVTLSASYLSDALGDLARSIVDLKNGATESMAQFEEEPGEYRWLFYRNDDQLRVLILSFYDMMANEPNEKGKVIFDAECSFTSFEHAFVTALERLLNEHGIEGYKARWIEHEFPMESYNKLRL